MNQYIPIRLKRRQVSLLLHRKTLVVSVVLILVFLAVVILSIGSGDMKISPPDVVRSLLGVGADGDEMVIRKLRLPRIVLSLLVGASLAAAGAILQGLIRNPLASPDIVGVTGGASAVAVVFIAYVSPMLSIRWLPAAAMLGAVAIAVLLYVLAWKKGITPIRLVLVGVGLSSLTSAMTTMMILFSPKDNPGQIFLWLTGSVYGANWENVLTLLPWTLVLVPAAIVWARHIDIQQLGDDTAAGVGSAVQFHRVILLLFSVALAGSSVAVAGGIGFVGLIAPHIARKLVGSGYGGILPVSAILGALIVVLADLAGRTLFLPLDVPAGVFTSAVGAPFFIYLLYARRNA